MNPQKSASRADGRQVWRTEDYGSGPDKTPEENRAALDACLADACASGAQGIVHVGAGEYGAPQPTGWLERAQL